MAQKHCYFKDCTSRADHSGRTLFNFPYRDAERLFRWLELTGCTKQELERKPRHVCDLHFDPKYFAICQRRKVLVGKALPELNRVYYATSTGSAAADTTGHPLTEEEGDGDEEEHSLIIREDVLDEEEDDEVDEIVVDEIESLKYEEDQLESLERIDAEAEEVPPEEEQEIVKRGKAVGPGKSAHLERIPEKRPIPSSPEISSRNQIESRTFSNKKPKIEKQAAPPPSTSNLPDISPSAKIITMKGVQYIQMSKHVYLAEQQMARDEISYWKNIVMGFKQQLEDVEF